MTQKPPFPEELAEALEAIKEREEWASFGELALKCIEKWRGNLSIFSFSEDSIEKIALERVKWTSMVAGVETLFLQMDELVKELKQRRKDDDD